MLRAAEVIRALGRAGFVVDRQRGSHVILKHQDGRHTVVPDHGGEDLDRRTLRDILRQIELSEDEFVVLLRRRGS